MYFYTFSDLKRKMGAKIIIVLMIAVFAFANGFQKCPSECICSLDYAGRYKTLCEKGSVDEKKNIERERSIKISMYSSGHKKSPKKSRYLTKCWRQIGWLY